MEKQQQQTDTTAAVDDAENKSEHEKSQKESNGSNDSPRRLSLKFVQNLEHTGTSPPPSPPPYSSATSPNYQATTFHNQQPTVTSVFLPPPFFAAKKWALVAVCAIYILIEIILASFAGPIAEAYMNRYGKDMLPDEFDSVKVSKMSIILYT